MCLTPDTNDPLNTEHLKVTGRGVRRNLEAAAREAGLPYEPPVIRVAPEMQIVTYAQYKRMMECVPGSTRPWWLPPEGSLAEVAYIYGGYLSRPRRLLRWIATLLKRKELPDAH